MAAPPRSSNVASAPRAELGTVLRVTNTGPLQFSRPVLDERETSRELRWPQSNQTYASMLNDAQAGGLYRGLTYPIRAYRYWLDPNGARPETVERVSRDYNLPVGSDGVFFRRRGHRRFSFDEHLEDALRAIVYGLYPFEQVVDITQRAGLAVNGGWAARLRKLAPRPPHTITRITPAPDGGLESITVPALHPSGDVTRLVGTVDLPVDRLVMYVWDREGANWRGRSMFRDCYRPWKLKDRVLRVGAINIERAGGVPYIEAPEGADRQLMEQLHVLATSFRVGDGAGAALPHGATLKFASAAGGDEAINYVRLMNEEMARAWLMMWMTAGQTSTGHGSTEQTGRLLDNFSHVQHAAAKWFTGVFSRHVIEDDVEWNEGPGEEYAPLLRFTPVGDPLDALAGELDDAQREGALPPDSGAAAAVKGEMRGRRRPTRPAAPAAAGTSPLRDLLPHEQAAATDFAALQAAHETAVAGLVEDWQELRAGQVDALVEQTRQAVSLEELTQVLAPTVGGLLMRAVLSRVAAEAVTLALDEARAQGAVLAPPSTSQISSEVDARADATAALLAMSLSDAARRRAVALAGGHATPETVAAGVREHLEGLSDAWLVEQLGGAVTAGQGAGRRAVFEQAEQADLAVRFYSSSLLDASACSACEDADGREYSTLAAAAIEFPTGGRADCKGGLRCRCVIVAVYDESAASVE